MSLELHDDGNGFKFNFDKASKNFILMTDEEKIKFFKSLSVSDRNTWFISSLKVANRVTLDSYTHFICDIEQRCAKPVDGRDGLILPNGLIVPISANEEERHRGGIKRYFQQSVWNPELEEVFLNAGGIVLYRNILMLNESVSHYKMKTRIQSGVDLIIATYKALNIRLKTIELSFNKSTYFFDAQTLERVPFSLSLATERKRYRHNF